MTGVRLPVALETAIAAWAKRQDDRPSKAEAIRRLVELGLSSAKPIKLPNKKAASKSSAMAGEEIDRLQQGKAMPPEEQASRKRRLLKGPKEFRDIRADIPKKAKR